MIDSVFADCLYYFFMSKYIVVGVDGFLIFIACVFGIVYLLKTWGDVY